MGWGWLGKLVEVGSGRTMIDAWMAIETPLELRLTIRNTIRDWSEETPEYIANHLKSLIQQFRIMGEDEKRSRAIIVLETLIEEVNRLRE